MIEYRISKKVIYLYYPSVYFEEECLTGLTKSLRCFNILLVVNKIKKFDLISDRKNNRITLNDIVCVTEFSPLQIHLDNLADSKYVFAGLVFCELIGNKAQL